MAHWEGYRGIVDNTYRDGDGGGGRGGPSPFSERWSPPTEKDALVQEWVRLFPGPYIICRNCNQPLLMSMTGETKCHNCNTVAIGPEMPVFPFFSKYVPYAGPRHDGWTVACRCYRGSVKVFVEGQEMPKPCTLCLRAKQVYDETIEPYKAAHGGNTPPKGDKLWKTAFSLSPNMHTAHNLARLGYFHDVEEEGNDGNSYTNSIPCTEGIIGHDGTPMKCSLCKQGVERYWGKRGYWAPSEPTSERGHLHTLRLFEREKLSKRCNSCGVGTIAVAAYACPSCKQTVLDCYDDDTTTEDIKKAASGKTACPYCGYGTDKNQKLEEVIQCTHIEGTEVYEGCDNPVRTTLFDVNLALSTRGEKLDSQVIIQDYNFDPFPEEHIERIIQPIDFRFLCDIKTETQAKLLHIQDPFSGAGERGAQNVQDYDK